MMRFLAIVAALLLGALLPATAEAQRRGQPMRPDTIRPPAQRPAPARPRAEPPRAQGDTLGPDSTKADLVEWAEPDSVMRSLLDRAGYIVTRYQGDVVRMMAQSNELRLEGDPSAVSREGVLLVGDTILYNDATRNVTVLGDTAILRDPGRGSDVVARGFLRYDLEAQRGVVQNVRTSTETGGETWYVHSRLAGIELPDSAAGSNASLYGRGGHLTSCNLDEPHYHFGVREVKVIRNQVLVARPAILYVSDIPVAWLPFVFQDLRSGRRSGMLPPRLGFTDIVRNGPGYRRSVENLGYYFALNDYSDLELSLDWRSGARPTPGDPGFLRYRGIFNYRWLDRFMTGGLQLSRENLSDGRENSTIGWRHSQEFSQATRLTTNVNYVTSTLIREQLGTNPFQVLGTIRSNASYSTKLGPASVSLGGSQTQYPGREQIDRTLPTLNISTRPISPVSWLVWTPNLQADRSDQFKLLRPEFRFVPRPGGGFDTTAVIGSRFSTRASLASPVQIFGFNWSNQFSFREFEDDYPQQVRVYADVEDTTTLTTRTFARRYEQNIDWQTGISLPAFSQGRWNFVPSVSIVNVDNSAGFLIRNEQTGGEFVRQSKRLQYGAGISPTFFGLFPGFGPFSRIRHAITPSLQYSYAPTAEVSNEFLRALGRSRQSYLGSLAQNQLTLGINTNVEAKRRSATDSVPEGGGEKIKLLSLNLDQLSYDFERYAELKSRAEERGADPSSVPWYRGLTNSTYSVGATSDLLPGFSIRTRYDLYAGSAETDTARFSPFRTGTDLSFTLDRNRNPLIALARVLGVPGVRRDPLQEKIAPTEADTFAQAVARQPMADGRFRPGAAIVPAGQGWQASFSYNNTRSRRITGDNVVLLDPAAECEREGFFVGTPFFDRCVENLRQTSAGSDSTESGRRGGTIYRSPDTQTMNSSVSFQLTPLWAMAWSTVYDIEASQFASHVVSLQRDLHDWRATFAFNQASNGNFAFSFFIALKAEPDLKFDYNRSSYGRR